MVNLSLCTLSPVAVLIALTLGELLLSIDGGALASVVLELESSSGHGLNLTFFEVGALSSLTTLGHMLGSPLFAYAAQSIHPQFLISLGLSTWSGFTLMFAGSVNYVMIAFARFIIGFGRAAFGCLAPPMILDSAPHAQRTIWIGIYYSASPLGVAIGFVFGAQASEILKGWFYPFIIEAFAMLPLIFVLLLTYKDPKYYAKKEDGLKENLRTQVSILLKNPLYVCLIVGGASSSFTLSGMAFWVWVI